MLKDAFDKVKSVLEPYVLISLEVSRVPDKRLPELMLRLLKEKELYQKFQEDPDGILRTEGIDPKSVDVKMFSDLAKTLHTRALRREAGLDRPEVTVQKKETDQNRERNFDHEKSWLVHYESQYYIWRSKGAVEDKEKSESSQTNKNFEESGIDTFNDKLLKYEVNLLFFPSQPLVTPELLEKIKSKLMENNCD